MEVNMSLRRNEAVWAFALCGVVALVAMALAAPPVYAVSISGTLSNFDVFNDTPTESDGAELELEGIHSSDIAYTYPSHYLIKNILDYDDGVHFGTRIIYDDYSFGGNDLLAQTAHPDSTNGHLCVNTPGCEHFGFSVRQQPTSTRFYWRDINDARINAEPLAIPSPSWVYIPPAAPGVPPVVQAIVEVPEVEDHAQRADSIWMKVVKTEIEREVELEELISGNAIVPEIEVETEWELLEGGLNGDKEAMHEDDLADGSKSVIRRYEFYEYTGAYDAEHEPLSEFLNDCCLEPPPGELGDFIAANMVAVNFVPEPTAIVGSLLGLSLIGVCIRRRRQDS
jgi:hypothetical protein